MIYVIYILAGLFSGILAGMGMGGGTILIPVLTIMAGIGQHAAQGINMLSYIPGAIIALIVHQRQNRLHIKQCLPLLSGGVAGAIGGALIAMSLDAQWLKRLFGLFLLAAAIFQLISGEKSYKKPHDDKN